MKRLDRILAIVDPTAVAQPALDKATLLARRFGASLELFICDFDPALSGQPYFDTQKLRQLREEFVSERVEFLEEMADDLRGEGIATETHVHWDNPVFRGIVRRVQGVLAGPHRQGHPLPLGHPADAAHQHGLEPDPYLPGAAAAREARRVAQATPIPGRTRSRAPRRQAGGARSRHPRRRRAAVRPAGRELHAVHAFFPAALFAASTTMAGIPVVTGMSADEIVESERRRVAGVL